MSQKVQSSRAWTLLADALLKVLKKEAAPVGIPALVERVKVTDDTLAREIIWHLIAEKRVELTPKWQVRMLGKPAPKGVLLRANKKEKVAV